MELTQQYEYNNPINEQILEESPESLIVQKIIQIFVNNLDDL